MIAELAYAVGTLVFFFLLYWAAPQLIYKILVKIHVLRESKDFIEEALFHLAFVVILASIVCTWLVLKGDLLRL